MDPALVGRMATPGAAQSDAVERARTGDRAAFEVLVRSRVDRLHRTACAILGNEADAFVRANGGFLGFLALTRIDRISSWRSTDGKTWSQGTFPVIVPCCGIGAMANLPGGMPLGAIAVSPSGASPALRASAFVTRDAEAAQPALFTHEWIRPMLNVTTPSNRGSEAHRTLPAIQSHPPVNGDWPGRLGRAGNGAGGLAGVSARRNGITAASALRRA